MIYQLPNGRVIEMSLEQYLSMTDEELKDLNGLDNSYSSEVTNPFYRSSLKDNKRGKIESPDIQLVGDVEYIQEKESPLDEISDIDKLNDEYFHPDDV